MCSVFHHRFKGTSVLLCQVMGYTVENLLNPDISDKGSRENCSSPHRHSKRLFPWRKEARGQPAGSRAECAEAAAMFS